MPEISTSCPYCGEPIDLFADDSAGAQDYVEDCPVCCRPMRVQLLSDGEGEVEIRLLRDDEA